MEITIGWMLTVTIAVVILCIVTLAIYSKRYGKTENEG